MSTLITTTAQIGTIKDAGGNATAMTIDSSGRVTQPTKPNFHVREGAAGSASGTTGVITFNIVDHNIGSCYNTANGRFTAPVAGIYHFCFDSLVSTDTSGSALGDGQNMAVTFIKNGNEGDYSMKSFNKITGGTQFNTIHRIDCIQLSASDYVQVKVTSEYMYRDNSGRFDATFQGFLIG